MAITPPVPITAGPPVPNSNDPQATFDTMFEASLTWQRDSLRPQANALAANMYANAQEVASMSGDASADAAAAAASATSAGTSATNASNSATAAGNSATSAAASAVQASKLNLGPKSSPPTVDNQGAALLQGATYYDTTLGKWRAWNGSAWVDPVSVTAGVTSINGQSGALSFGFGLRNKIINGAFNINQRGYTSGAATTAGQYIFDRWKVTGTGGVTFNTTANKTTITIPSGQTLQQVIEGSNLESGTYLLSWGGTAQGRVNSGNYGASGAVTATITGGSNTTIEFNAGTVELVMFEKTTVITPFAYLPYSIELAMCQRYYYRIKPGAGKPFAFGANYSTLAGLFAISFPVTMRLAPFALEHSGVANQYTISQSGSGSTVLSGAPVFATATREGATFTGQVASGLTQFWPGTLSADSINGANAYLGWSAEL